MRNQLWIIILLMVCIGQWEVRIVEMSPELVLTGRIEQSRVEGVRNENRVSILTKLGKEKQERAVWRSREDLGGLVDYQVRVRLPWLYPCPNKRSHSKSGSQGGGKGQGQPRGGVEQAAQEAEQRQTKGGGESQSDSSMEPEQWGLTPEMSMELPERLNNFWQRYLECFRSKTRNMGQYAYHYLSALLRLETKRNYSNIGTASGVSGENIQHFMSNSPWSGEVVIDQVQAEIKAIPDLQQGSVLLLDESANEKAGDKSVGAGRQYNGRLGKVELSQMGVFLAYVNLNQENRLFWSWVDGELFLQEEWFTPEMAEIRQQVGLPPEREFKTKIKLGWTMIERTQARGLPFEAVAFDDAYGRSTWLRDKTDAAGIIYMADVPHNTQVYLEKPVLGIPEAKPGRRGPKPTRLQVLNGVTSYSVSQVARRPDTTWHNIRVRPTERGELHDPFIARLVWTLRDGAVEPVQEWLVIRHEAKKRFNYSLCNAPANTSLDYLAWLKCQRYFVERANQDAKSELGWNELIARKYRAWGHHLALVILAAWFVAQTKWVWSLKYFPDPALFQLFDLEFLPALSMANIRALLRAAMPLPQPNPQEAVSQITKHLINRSRSRKSRFNRQKAAAHAPP